MTQQWRGVVNAVLYGVQFSDTLGPEEVSRVSTALLTGPLGALTLDEKYGALVAALESNEELDTVVRIKHSESELRDFLGRVVAELDGRRPWTEPAFRELPLSEWTRFSGFAPVARVDLAWPAIQGPLRRMLKKPAGDDRYWLLLRMRSGTEVALVWPGWAGESATALLADQVIPARNVVEEVLGATALTPSNISIINR
ncbi:hypothetical protein [Nocardia sp. NPDC056100]|uniref:hypothetical protein n=1 Tax=Nocardia sp. NPDC056100 TaxID=3345712 RepID=UPI0035E30959